MRAVHLEVADSLSPGDFLSAFTLFISVRGKPSVVYSDNGTKFVAAAKELNDAVSDLIKQEDEPKTKMTNKEIEWHFSPPHGPHFGGAWERLVQSAKPALQVKMSTQVTTDQVLRTQVAEVMSLLNCRPLTHVRIPRFYAGGRRHDVDNCPPRSSLSSMSIGPPSRGALWRSHGKISMATSHSNSCRALRTGPSGLREQDDRNRAIPSSNTFKHVETC